ncbi:hypothetical protein VYU27_009787, partial [Nannochloropsis oceanica]
VAFYNIFAIYVTHFLSSVWHAILDNFRPISVWGTDLLIFYVFTHGRFGEAWTIYSWLQFSGMLILFFGTAVYNGSVPWLLFPSSSSLEYEKVEEGEEGGEGGGRRTRAHSIEDFAPVIRTEPSMASPALMRSPLIRDRSDPRYIRERGASLYGTPRTDRAAGRLASSLTPGGGWRREGGVGSYGSTTTFAPVSFQTMHRQNSEQMAGKQEHRRRSSEGGRGVMRVVAPWDSGRGRGNGKKGVEGGGTGEGTERGGGKSKSPPRAKEGGREGGREGRKGELDVAFGHDNETR